MSSFQTLELAASGASGSGGITEPAALTAKETQALLWHFKGKTSWEIAIIQSCSVATINFHFANIRRKFEVSSRGAALLKAIESGALKIDETDLRGRP